MKTFCCVVYVKFFQCRRWPEGECVDWEADVKVKERFWKMEWKRKIALKDLY